MGISHVIRGDDHLGNTPKQIHIYRALGAEPPRFGHVPLILGPDGKRLSKRHGATAVGAWLDEGYLAEGLVNYLVRLGWAHGDEEIFSAQELFEKFDVAGIGLAAGRWNAEKLKWVNQQWMARLPVAELARRVTPLLRARGLEPDDRLAAAVGTVQQRSATLAELADNAAFYFTPDQDLVYDPKAVKKHLKAARAPLLEELLGLLADLEPWTEQALEEAIGGWVQAKGIKLGMVAQPMRVSITGRGIGPGIYESLQALGRESTLTRVKRGWQLAAARAARL